MFIFTDYLSSYYESQALHLSQNFLVLLDKSMFSLFCFVFLLEKKGFSAYMKNAFSLPSPSYA